MTMNPYNKAEETVKDITSSSPVESVYTPMVKSVLYNEARRIQKIVSAIYLVTELFEEQESLKGHMRATGVLLISLGHIHERSDIKDIIATIARILTTLDTLMSYIELARLTQKISDMNATILSVELTSMHMHISKRYQSFLDQELELANDTSVNNTASLENFFADAPALTGTDQSSSWYPATMRKSSNGSPTSTLASASKGQVSLSNGESQSPEEMKEDRKRQIIEIVKDRGEVSIKDIAPRILKCSEKTLQRDLQELISQGTLKKTGDRRWSKYSLSV